MSTTNLISAIRQKDLVTATDLTTTLLEEKFTTALQRERQTIFKDLNKSVNETTDKCAHCGSTKNLRKADDYTVLCKDCDVED